MSIDAVFITTGNRLELLTQSLRTLFESLPADGHVTIVFDGPMNFDVAAMPSPRTTIINNTVRQGASAARNIGASSIPKYRRGKYVMFCDDDCYFTPKWDEKLLNCYQLAHSAFTTIKDGVHEGWKREKYDRIVSGHAHPFNHSEDIGTWREPLVISTVNMLMPWSLWDDAGPFDEPGGAGGSEDYALCMRAKAKGYGFAVTEPQCILHTGITSSNGNPIIGQKEVMENNRRLEEIHGIVGKVIYK